MVRSLNHRTLLVSTLAAAFASATQIAKARAGPDDNPKYDHPMWVYANPADDYGMVAYDPRPNPWAVGALNRDQQAAANR